MRAQNPRDGDACSVKFGGGEPSGIIERGWIADDGKAAKHLAGNARINRRPGGVVEIDFFHMLRIATVGPEDERHQRADQTHIADRHLAQPVGGGKHDE